ncbi:uncharacterized protein LOC133968923 isoform X2 [Platichthys flesus]|uniref:uncharacterized protein LOC133933467 isoform X2 n=1 Tax=Platichthys flesus TaxID=8260 RepID=UPI002DBC3CE1|nr:uncharacterized protein LOC133933467 isoform X2 [Platichthys flesus]XP_062249291.1 uncharacterized protein LOC133958487 isoform X2 [Platichthys flesus]XP_062252225.1 uncharacterized protein LOC133961204 isoform X2 [Platichthys flesus]XP_062261165.1 uncharacterized protein LOC133968923 isoform X2 [Platichthys flesus]
MTELEVKKKKRDEALIKEKMQRTFSLRRQEVLQEPKIPEFFNKWPALFDVIEINLEFMRLTTVPLTLTFLRELDRLTGDLIRVFNTKGGATGEKIGAMMAKMENAAEDLRQTIKPKPDVKRSNASLDKVQSLLSSRKSLRLKEAQNLSLRVGRTYEHDIECSEAEADVAGTTMAIYTVQAEGDDHDGPGGLFADVGMVLEGVQVLNNLQSINHACVMLYGLVYALNLSYPKNLKYTFKAYQKILMDLESSKPSAKVRALKLKLLR